MNAPVSASALAASSLSQRKNAAKGSEMSFRKSSGGISLEAAKREAFRDLLWRAFPGCDSQEQLADKVSKVLRDNGEPVSSRQVKNWLGCHCDVRWRHVAAIGAVAGSEVFFKWVAGR